MKEISLFENSLSEDEILAGHFSSFGGKKFLLRLSLSGIETLT